MRAAGRVRGIGAVGVVVAVGMTAAGLSVAATSAAHASACGWMNPSTAPDARAHMLLHAMSLDDKISMLAGRGDATYYGTANVIPANPRLCIPALVFNDAGAGVADVQVGVTAFPDGIAQAASWDVDAQRAYGATLGWEAWHKGINVQLAPGVNIARVAENGRNFEYAGEDPYLAGQTGAAVIQGIQSQHVVATIKHYALNNQETNRMTVSSDADVRTMQEIYLPAFEAAVTQGGVGAAMCSYNKVNGVYACENPTLLDTYLKGQMGFTGWVMSDWTATHSTVKAANAGLDQEQTIGPGTYFAGALKTAVQRKQVPVSRVEDMVVRILRSMFRVGLFDHPAPTEPQGFAALVSTPDDVAAARRVAEEGMVLLKNDGVLPVRGTNRRIAVIGLPGGPVGANLYYQGGGSSHVPLAGFVPGVVSPWQGILQRGLADGDLVTYADGTAVVDAVAAAATADVAIVFAGTSDTEGVDRANLNLNTGQCLVVVGCTPGPSDPNALIAAVARANKHTVVVLNTGGPVVMPWLSSVQGVVEAWYPGQEDGNATAAVLFGDVNPSGKLPMTFPRSAGDGPIKTAAQWPGVNGHSSYSEKLLVGYRWYDAKGVTPLFPFGYGLSYTTFRYANLAITPSAGGASVSFDLTNTGSRAGAEVAQLYVSDPAASGEPPKQLKGYRKVMLEAGQTMRVTIPLDARSFAYWSTASNGWTVAPGCYQVAVGGSSRGLPLHGAIGRAGGAC